MSVKRIWLAASLAALTLAACGKKVEAADAKATASATAPAAAPAAGAAAEASATVKVNEGEPVDGDVTLTVPATAGAGAEIELRFTGPANSKDYIDLVPRGFTQTSGELGYVYIPAAAKGEKLRVPTAPGDYDVRYVLDLKGVRKVKAIQPLSITAATATLKLPASVTSAEPLSVEWTGPAGKGDYIDVVPKEYAATSGEIAYAYTSGGNPAKFSAPGAAGDYQVRYVLEGPGGRKVLASVPLNVAPAAAKLTAPDTADKGKVLVVEYEGPKRAGDYVDLVKKGYIATSGELSYFYADGKAANELKMPAEAGDYDIRYVMEAPGGRVVLAKRAIHVK
jgi:Ca-activated chloride channel family protein